MFIQAGVQDSARWGGQAAGWQQNNYHLAFYHFGESSKGWREGPVFKAADLIG